ncbi:MAG: hypothetical protein M3R27_08975 [Bacteroidota bacterium]|nr:hypothetical protein [Bacteroidota bacterium]
MSQEPKPMELLKSAAPELEAIMMLNADAGTDVKTLVLQELEYLRAHALTSPKIMECVPATIVMAVKSVIKQNLSLDPNAGLVYVKTRNFYVNVDGQDVQRTALEITPSANGIISINRQCGRVLDVMNPVVSKDATGKVTEVSVKILLPSHPEPRWETRTFDESDFYRWRRASHKENGKYKPDFKTPEATESLKYANENYTSWKGGIDPEFSRAKAIRHGLKKLGTNQNEGKFTKIVIPSAKEVIIDSRADQQAMNEEYTQHEEVSSEIGADFVKSDDL